MPALKHLEERINSDQEWNQMYKGNLKQARTIAEKIPLIHVTANPDRGISFEDLILHPPHEIPTSEDIDYYSELTRSAENILDLNCSAYFYAGRAHPDFGIVALAFERSCEEDHTGTATPFDTGGLAGGHIDSNLPDRHPETLRAFIQASMEQLKDWRQAFTQFLAAYFSPISDYWSENQAIKQSSNQATVLAWACHPSLKTLVTRPKSKELRLDFLLSGSPCQPDPDDLFMRNDDWRAWTFEVRFHEGQNIFDAVKWCSTEGYTEFITDILEELPPDIPFREVLIQFREREQQLDDGQDHCETLERWIQEEVYL
jgi:hypothetical protein